jgi:hypothetical protein
MQDKGPKCDPGDNRLQMRNLGVSIMASRVLHGSCTSVQNAIMPNAMPQCTLQGRPGALPAAEIVNADPVTQSAINSKRRIDEQTTEGNSMQNPRQRQVGWVIKPKDERAWVRMAMVPASPRLLAHGSALSLYACDQSCLSRPRDFGVRCQSGRVPKAHPPGVAAASRL